MNAPHLQTQPTVQALLQSPSDPSNPSLVSMAGPAAACRAACEANASLASGTGCTAFIFPSEVSVAQLAALSWRNCTFYASSAPSGSTRPLYPFSGACFTAAAPAGGAALKLGAVCSGPPVCSLRCACPQGAAGADWS